MAAYGRITTLPIRTGNPALPRLIEYDSSALLERILALPFLRAFYDLTDLTKMTVAGGLVSALQDLGPKGLHGAITGAERPTFVAGAINGVPAVRFDGTQRIGVAGLFNGAGNELSVSAGLYYTGDNGSRHLLGRNSNNSSANWYVSGGNEYRAFMGAAALAVPALANRASHAMFTMNLTAATAKIYADGLSGSGAPPAGSATGDGSIGARYEGVTNDRWVGSIGHICVMDRDIALESDVRALLDEYARRKYRIA